MPAIKTDLEHLLNNKLCTRAIFFGFTISLGYIITVPFSWYAIHKWLEGSAYKTAMSWRISALAGITALAMALIAPSWQRFQTAVANPEEALKED